MGLNDRRFVESQYASAERLETWRSVWQPDPSGRTPQDVAVEVLRARRPARVLEVGCGTGQLAERMMRQLDAELIAVDLSPSMVEETRSRVVDARVADVEQLPFADGEFDCAVAAWVLYHLPDLDRGLAELARVLRPGGRVPVGEHGVRSQVGSRDVVEVPAQGGLAVLAHERGASALGADQRPQVGESFLAVGDGDQAAARAQHPGQLGQAAIEVW